MYIYIRNKLKMIKTVPYNFAKHIDKKHIYTGVQSAVTTIGGFSLENNISEIKLNVIQLFSFD